MEEYIELLEMDLDDIVCYLGKQVTFEYGQQVGKAIENLLKRYKELEEENKQLKTDKALQIQMNKRLIEEGIPISVIQNKIDEYLSFDNEHKTYTKDGRENFTMEYFKALGLQELLEERNK